MEEAPRPADPQMSLLKQLLSEWMERERNLVVSNLAHNVPSLPHFVHGPCGLTYWNMEYSRLGVSFFVSQGTRDRNPSLTSELNRIVSCWLLASSVKDARQEGKWNGTRDIADLFTFCEPHNFIRPQILRKRKLKKKQTNLGRNKWVPSSWLLLLDFFLVLAMK